MNNEDLALAISYLDDDLIADAHTQTTKRLSSANKWMSIAASFALVICLSFAALVFSGNSIGTLFSRSSFEVSVFGENTDNVSFSISDRARSSLIELSDNGISHLAVPITISANGKITISVSGGELQIYDGEAFVLLCQGNLYETDEDFSAVWLLNSGESENFEILAENKNAIIKISLEHEGDSGNWFVEKTKIKK